jgi:hypothetical protein
LEMKVYFIVPPRITPSPGTTSWELILASEKHPTWLLRFSVFVSVPPTLLCSAQPTLFCGSLHQALAPLWSHSIPCLHKDQHYHALYHFQTKKSLESHLLRHSHYYEVVDLEIKPLPSPQCLFYLLNIPTDHSCSLTGCRCLQHLQTCPLYSIHLHVQTAPIGPDITLTVSTLSAHRSAQGLLVLKAEAKKLNM